MPRISDIKGWEVLDSRGNPTVAARVITERGEGEAMVPSGASTGRHEALELRDGDKSRYGGMGVLTAVGHVNQELNQAVAGLDTGNQAKLDRRLLEADGTPDKSNLGANAILAVSLAAARAEAAGQGVELYTYLRQLYSGGRDVLPVPQMNVINGGVHASNGLSIQEFHILPAGSASFARALRMGAEIYHALSDLLTERGFQVEVADEGGFGPKVDKSEDVLDLLVAAIENTGYVPGTDAFLGLDSAASEFYDVDSKEYELDGEKLSSVDLAFRYTQWREKYPLISIEDPFGEDDWEAWESFVERSGQYVQVVGDDLYATNVTRIREGIKREATNAVLIKPNQVGTLSETLQAVQTAQEAGQNVVVSHRSGETEDTFISDLAAAVGASQIKAGAPARSERVAKYNRLLSIENQTGAGLAHNLQPWLAALKR